MKKEEKKAPLLDPKIEKEQDIERPDNSDGPNPDSSEKPTKEDPKKVPESNDPAGYGDEGKVKKSPYKKK